ncbi:MAG: phosphoesterase [Acidobacteria bacterium]|nr:phosphoesterase [Acidobacteriota bacterium]
MKKSLAMMLLAAALLGGPLFAQEGAVPKGIPHLDHVFVIMMENHAYGQIVGNPNAPFANSYMNSANAATNYYAVGHPSSTNYLEIVGGSNFGVRSDNAPDWHNTSCTPNLISGLTNFDTPNSGNVCPIRGAGTDAATPAVDTSGNECTAPCSLVDLDGAKGFTAAPNTVGKTIADQLSERGMTWKSYQESLPPSGADKVTYSDGYYTDVTVPGTIAGGLLKLYAAKHNPFVYFASMQEALASGAHNFAGFEGEGGLYEDLASGEVPRFSLVVPNQCNDQHGRGNGGSYCDFDFNTNGTQQGLNPALIYVGDLKLRNLVHAIHASRAWRDGRRSAIVVVWDENDYSLSPNTNRVLAIVETNYGRGGRTSNQFYTHFSLLRSVEGALGLPCLNHACDANTNSMSDLFGHEGDDDDGRN